MSKGYCARVVDSLTRKSKSGSAARILDKAVRPVTRSMLIEALERRQLLSAVVVNTIADTTNLPGSGTVSLRDAIAVANSSSAPTDISFDPTVFATPQKIMLSGSELELQNTSEPTTITGPAAGVTISGNNASRVLNVDSGVMAAVSNVTVTDGNGDGYWGGGVLNSGFLTLTNDTISGNTAGYVGGGIYNSETPGAKLILTDVTIANNSAANDGGGLFNDQTALLTNVTISSNSAPIGGGIVSNFHSEITTNLENITVANNSAVSAGGGILNAGGSGQVSLANTIIAGNTIGSSGTGPDIDGSVTSLGNNLIGQSDGSSGWIAGSDQTGTTASPLSADLGSLANNGGSTQTLLPATNSPAVNAGSNALVPNGVTTDQRGLPRVVGGTVDIGAVEIANPRLPDLIVSNANAVTNSDGTVTVNWNVSNVGNAATSADWTDSIYKSDSATFDPSTATLLQAVNVSTLSSGGTPYEPLAVNGNYPADASITLDPGTLGVSLNPGDHLFVVTNDAARQTGPFERDTNNNVLGITIPAASPGGFDLATTSLDSPASVNLNDTLKFSYTVQDIGGPTSYDGWYDEYFLSDSPVYDGSARYIGENYIYQPKAIQSGGAYTESASVSLSQSLPTGDQYLIVVSNAGHYYSEADTFNLGSGTEDTNNVASAPITITAPNVDLALDRNTPPTLSDGTTPLANQTVVPGQSVQAIYTLFNNGSDAANGPWYDEIWLSSSPTLNTNTARYLGQVGHYTPLNGGSSAQQTVNLTIPSNAATGQQYIIYQVNAYGGYQSETDSGDDTNNTLAVPVTIEQQNSDLVTSNVSVTDSGGNALTSAAPKSYVTVNWTVTNNGSTAAASTYNYWYDSVYLSENPTIDPSAHFLGDFYHGGSLAAGGSYTGSQSFYLPSNVNANAKYIIVVANSIDQVHNPTETPYVPETDFTNNDASTAFTIAAPNIDLQVSGVSASDPTSNTASSSSNLAGAPGDTLKVSWTVTNNGADSTAPNYWYDSVYFSAKPTFDSSAYRIGSFYSPASYSGLAGGGSYTQTDQQVTIPSSNYTRIVGSGYILVVANDSTYYSDQPENDTTTDSNGNVLDANNVQAIPITLSGPDLAITSTSPDASTGITTTPGASVSLSWTVTNQGPVATNYPYWYDSVVLSPDGTYDPKNDVTLNTWYNGGLTNYAGLAAGASYTQSQNVTIPTSAGSQDKYLLIITDRYGYVKDQDQQSGTYDDGRAVDPNNIVAIPLTINGAELQASNVSAPASAIPGQAIPISYTVSNIGNADASAFYGNYDYDYVYLSPHNVLANPANPTSEQGVIGLGNLYNSGQFPVASGSNYTVNSADSNNFTIPANIAPGQYYLFIKPDVYDYVSSGHGSNDISQPVAITINGPDLIAGNVQAPTSASLSESVNVSWTITNQGQYDANGPWYDLVYLSNSSTFNASTATEVGSFYTYGKTPLSAGNSYTNTQSVQIPSTANIGTEYLFVVADGYNYQGETDKTNNVSAGVPITIGAPDLTVSAASLGATTADVSGTLPVSWTVLNQGDYQASSNWYDTIWFSKSTTFSPSTAIYAQNYYIYGVQPLSANGTYTESQNVPVPSNLGQGSWYVFVQANRYGSNGYYYYYYSQGETDYSNNVALAGTVTVAQPDLQVTNLAASVDSTGKMTVTWNDQNNSGSVQTGFYDYVQVVDTTTNQNVYSTTDYYYPSSSGNIDAGNSASRLLSLNLTPAQANDPLKVTVTTNFYQYLRETDYSNNIQTITLQPPIGNFADLSVSNLQITGSENGEVTVTWDDVNNGTADATTPFTDAINIVNTTTGNTLQNTTLSYDASQPNSAIAANGGSLARSFTFQLPTGADGSGNVKFTITTNSNGGVFETNSSNNTATQTATAPFTSFPDLQVQNLSLDPSSGAQSGQAITVNWTDANTGVGPTPTPGNGNITQAQDFDTAGDANYTLTQNGSNPPASVQTSGDGNPGNYLRLASGSSGGQQNTVAFDQSATGLYNHISVDFDFRMTPVYGRADGFGLALLNTADYGTAGAGPVISEEPNLKDSFGLGFDIYNNGEISNNHLSVHYNNTQLEEVDSTPFGVDLASSAWEHAHVTLDAANGGSLLTVVLTPNGGSPVTEIANYFISGLQPYSSRLAFGARTGGETANEDLDNININYSGAGSWTDHVHVVNTDTNQVVADLDVPYDATANGAIDAGGTVDRSATFTLPDGSVGAGNLSVTVTTDYYGQVYESNTTGDAESNNTVTATMTSTLANYPDLQVSSASLTPPSGWAPGDNVTLNWTDQNNGDGAASALWNDHVQVINTSTNTTILDTQVPYDPTASGNSALAAGSSLNQQVSFSLPNNSNAFGNFKVVITTNSTNSIFEYNGTGTAQTNNTYTFNQLSAPDLQVQNLSVSPSTGLQSGGNLTINWTDANTGNAATPNAWYDLVSVVNTTTGQTQYYQAEYYDPSQGGNGNVAAGDSRNRSLVVTLPQGPAGVGTYSVTVTADYYNQIAEYNAGGTGETNNAANTTTTSALANYPDLQVNGLKIIGLPNGVMTGPVYNSANGHYYYLLSPTDWSDAQALAKSLGGNLATVRNQQENDFLQQNFADPQGSVWIGYNDAADPADSKFVWASGETPTPAYTNWYPGEPNNQLSEFYAELYGNGQWNNLPSSSQLAGVMEVSAPLADQGIGSGRYVTVQWNDANTGNGDTAGQWYDNINVTNTTTNSTLVNAEPIFDPTAAGSGNIAAGQAQGRAYSFRLPDGSAGAGSLQISVTADVGNSLYEYNTAGTAETNNSQSITANSPLSVYPDLTVTNLSTSGDSTGKVTIDWGDNNAGNGATNSGWYDRVNVVDATTNQTLANSDVYFDPSAGNLAANGGSSARTFSFQLPQSAANDNLTVTVTADIYNNVFESNSSGTGETNNSTTESVTAPLASYANIAVSGLNVSANPQSGQNVTVSWTDTNSGGAAPNGWSDLLTVTDGNGNAIVYQAIPVPALGAGGSDPSYTFALPHGDAGVGMFAVKVTANYNNALYVSSVADAAATTSFTSTRATTDFPDLQVTNLNVPTFEFAGQQATVSWTVTNTGQSSAAGSWNDQVILYNDTDGTSQVLGTVANPSSLAGNGGSYTQTQTYTLPSTPGTYVFEVVTDSGNTVAETNENNNTKVAPNATISALYHASITSAMDPSGNSVVNGYDPLGTPVIINGNATYGDGSVVPNAPISVYVLTSGTTRTLSATTDSNGNFQAIFYPVGNEAGHYQLAADHGDTPAQPGSQTPQAAFDIVGMSANPSPISQTLLVNQAGTGTITLTNLSAVGLTGLGFAPSSVAPNITFNLTNSPTTLPAGGTATFSYSVTPSSDQYTNDNIVLHVTSAEGAKLDIPFYVNVLVLKPQLSANPGSLNTGMVVPAAGQQVQTLLSFQVSNIGGAATGDMTVQLPNTSVNDLAPFMTLVSPSTISSLAPGQSATVTLQLSPDPNLPLDQLYTGGIVIGNSNISLTEGYTFRPVASTEGKVHVQVSDDYTLNASDHPYVAGATVQLLDPYNTSTVIATGTTASDGTVDFTGTDGNGVPAGPYVLSVSAPQHSSYQVSIEVLPGVENDQSVFIAHDTVTYTWVVVPTQIQDQYTVQLVSTFDTQVPAPVLTLDSDPIPLIAPGQTGQMNLQLTNHGLIAADDVSLIVPTDPEYTFTPLTSNIGTLDAEQTMTIPVLVTRNAGGQQGGDCHLFFSAPYDYVPFNDPNQKIGHTALAAVDVPNRICDAAAVQSAINNFSSYIGNGYGSFGGGGGGGGGGEAFSGGVTVPAVQTEVADAKVKIEIDQHAVLTRTAFNGTLDIANSGSDPLGNVQVNIKITDSAGNDATDKFFFNPPTLSGFTSDGGIAPNTDGLAKFLFIPTNDAAPDAATVYNIGGSFTYTNAAGEQVTVPMFPATITVYPEAHFALNYFLQRDVYGLDPFETQPTPEPFVLGLLATNEGKGSASDLTITSDQPKIVDNQKGLLINFQIIGTQVGTQQEQPSLTADLGNFDPGQTQSAEFIMTSTLQGHFEDFSASFTHSDALGGKDTSLIDSVTLHELIHAVNVDDAGDPAADGKPDFLAHDSLTGQGATRDYGYADGPTGSGPIDVINDLPENLYLSDGTVAPVNDVATTDMSVSTGVQSNGSVTYTLTANDAAGWNYLELPDPGAGLNGYGLAEVIGPGGVQIKVGDNAWTTNRIFTDGAFLTTQLFHLLNHNSTAATDTYQLVYETAAMPAAVTSISTVPAHVASAFDTVDITFSQPIDPSTFDPSQVTLTLNNVNVSTANLKMTSIGGNTYEISGLAADAATPGDYGLSFNGLAVKDANGMSATGAVATLWHLNAGPTLNAFSITGAQEGTAFSPVTATFTDPDPGEHFTVTVNYGDGTGVQPLPYDATANTISLSHVFSGSGDFTVTLTVTDSLGLSSTQSDLVTVGAVAPTVSLASTATAHTTAAFTESGTFTAFGSDPVSVTADYGDGSGPQTVAVSGNTFNLSHLYGTPGMQSVTVVVTDTANGATANASTVINVLPPAPLATAFSVNAGAAQRSEVTQLTVTFDHPVTFSAGAFTLDRRNTGGSGLNNGSAATDVSALLKWTSHTDPSTGITTVTITFAGLGVDAQGSLSDGIYDLVVHASLVHDAYGQQLGSADQSYAFHRLFGDSNGDKTVDVVNDLAAFKQAYNSTIGQANYVSYFDYNDDGKIDSTVDYTQFKKRLGLKFVY